MEGYAIRIEHIFSNRDIINVDKKDQSSYEGHHNDTQNPDKDLRVLKKSEEILRKKARAVGQKT